MYYISKFSSSMAFNIEAYNTSLPVELQLQVRDYNTDEVVDKSLYDIIADYNNFRHNKEKLNYIGIFKFGSVNILPISKSCYKISKCVKFYDERPKNVKFLDLTKYTMDIASVRKIDVYGFIWQHASSLITLDNLLSKFEEVFGAYLYDWDGVAIPFPSDNVLYITFEDKEKLRLLLTKYKVLKGED